MTAEASSLRQRTPDETSPYNFMQERYRHDPWALLVGCILFNMVKGKKAQPIHEEFLSRWPEPGQMGLYRVDTNEGPLIGDWSRAAGKDFETEMMNLFKPLGLQLRRVDRIYKMTVDFLLLRPDINNHVDVKRLHGIGKYGSDSFNMFWRGYLVEDVKDKELKKYIEWALSLPEGTGQSLRTSPLQPGEAGQVDEEGGCRSQGEGPQSKEAVHGGSQGAVRVRSTDGALSDA